jgi:hypothetical protein
MTQAWQVPVQEVLQQTPSAQAPEVHWLVPVQAPPRSRLGEHMLVVVSQNEPLAQFASAVHAVGEQTVEFMQLTPPGQAAVVAVPGTHAPLPSQAAGVVVSWLPVHDEVPVHGVAAAATAHLPAPSHVPVVPQVVVPAVQSLSALLPAGSMLQTPFVLPVFVPMQDWQVPVQSLSQQTLSAVEHTPLAQSEVAVHASPGFSLGLLPPAPPWLEPAAPPVPEPPVPPAPEPAAPPVPVSPEPPEPPVPEPAVPPDPVLPPCPPLPPAPLPAEPPLPPDPEPPVPVDTPPSGPVVGIATQVPAMHV